MIRKVLSKGRSMYQQAFFPYTSASLKRKVIFIHIPKAAGTAVRVALGEPETGRRHLPWWVYEQASPKKFQEFYKFAFVRNPLDRALSGYKYLKAGGNKAGDLEVARYLEKYNGFNDFVDRELVAGSMINHPIFRPQAWYLCDWKGDIQVDYVGRFETIDNDFKKIAKHLHLGCCGGLPLINKSTECSEIISETASSAIREVYRADYHFFGY
ncbi:sulfotransferase family 2 domain-containing protein [Halomonas sp. B23F22_10]|uniref:sulfotransferase family 2 domain-containing protein n=1 Tax=Halomonas sp. B23F22_10 TaxID=3459515 RepID=UPI00373F6785